MQEYDVDLRLSRSSRLVVEHIRHAGQQLTLTLLDLVRVQIELRRQIAHRSVALQSRQRGLRLESRAVLRLGRLVIFAPVRLPDWRQKIHLTQLFRFAEPPLK